MKDKHTPINEIPRWVHEYNQANYQSSAGKAIKLVINKHSALLEQNRELKELVNEIASWKLPETGKFWDEDQKEPMSYEAAFGSNGVRDYFKSKAEALLNKYPEI